MYAVIESGGKQHRVEEGGVVRVERIAGEVGDEVVFDRVLMVSGDTVQLGGPNLDGARVRGTVVEQGRGPKTIRYTFKRRQNSNRKQGGHRQAYTAVKIDAIET
jgi:large subunit ribosomal protein L21